MPVTLESWRPEITFQTRDYVVIRLPEDLCKDLTFRGTLPIMQKLLESGYEFVQDCMIGADVGVVCKVPRPSSKRVHLPHPMPFIRHEDCRCAQCTAVRDLEASVRAAKVAVLNWFNKGDHK